jgi:hypothetical protein
METILKDHGFSPEEICIVRWQLNDYGGYYTALMEAITRADSQNLEKLRKGYPVEVAAIERFKDLPPFGGPDFYAQIAGKLDAILQFKGRF